MRTYADANALVRLYLHLPGRDEALAFLEGRYSRNSTPLPVSELLRFEVRNAIERMVFESRTGGQWRVTPEAAAVAQANFTDSLNTGVIIRPVPLKLEDIEVEFESLAVRHTAREGFRTYDVIHVSSAVALHCERFLSFDAKANKLARLVGLETI